MKAQAPGKKPKGNSKRKSGGGEKVLSGSGNDAVSQRCDLKRSVHCVTYCNWSSLYYSTYCNYDCAVKKVSQLVHLMKTMTMPITRYTDMSLTCFSFASLLCELLNWISC